jgi:hypothetical protein
VIDVADRFEFAGKGSEFGAEAVEGEEALLFAGVGEAEVAMFGPARHPAVASVGEGELAAGMGFIFGC